MPITAKETVRRIVAQTEHVMNLVPLANNSEMDGDTARLLYDALRDSRAIHRASANLDDAVDALLRAIDDER